MFFSKLPSLFDRNFAIGFFLPVVLFLLVNIFLFSELDSSSMTITIDKMNQIDKLVSTTILGLASWFGGVVLLGMNRFILTFMEGYYFERITLLKQRHKKRFNELKQTILELKTYRSYISKKEHIPQELCAQNTKRMQKFLKDYSDKEQRVLQKFRSQHGEKIQKIVKDFPDEIEQILQKLSAQRMELMCKIVEDYPDQEQWILPTSFGNRIRAFEVYPRVMYGLDDIPGWDRLLAVIPKDYLNLVDSAKAQVDFWANFWFLSIIALGESLIIMLCNAKWGLLWFPFITFVFTLFAYYMAKMTVIDWGELVKSSYDLFLPELRQKIKFSHPTDLDEKSLWQKFSQAVIYRNPKWIPNRNETQDEDEE